MKKITLLLSLAFALQSFSTSPDPDKSIVDRFNLDYPQAQQTQWFEYEGYVTVRFFDKDVLCNLSYGADGKVIKSVRYYDKEMLAPFYQQRLKETFPNLDVYKITENTNLNGTDYVVILHNAKKYVQVLMNPAGDITIHKKFNKAQPLAKS